MLSLDIPGFIMGGRPSPADTEDSARAINNIRKLLLNFHLSFKPALTTNHPEITLNLSLSM
jgi:hypothetical protein